MDKLYSFDVFDTCITRTYTRPQDLFLDVARVVTQESMSSVDDKSVRLLAKQREAAEASARKHSKSEDILIHDIYDQLSNVRGNSFDVDAMLKTEIDLEISSVVPIQKTLALYQEIKEESYRVIFISDMYLPEDVVIAMLSKCGYRANADNLYISGEVGLTKRSGNLYQHVLKSEGIAPNKLTHYGDNVLSDIKMAKSAGIDAIHLPIPTQQSRYEKIFTHRDSAGKAFSYNLQKYSRHFRQVYTDPLTLYPIDKQVSLSRINAVSRVLFRNSSDDDSNDIDLAAIGYFIAAPLFASFVLWLLQTAQDKGISRLYFIARNGQIFCKLATVICKQLNFDIECRYLYGSRAAWYPSSFESFDSEFIEFLLKKYPNRSIREVFEDLSFSEESIAALLGALAGAPYDPIASKDEEAVRAQLNILAQSKCNHLVREHFSSCWENVVGYLSQEHFFDSGNVGIVDIGWSLSSHNALHRIVDKVDKKGFSGFYFGVSKNRQQIASNAPYYSFFSDIESKRHRWLFKLGAMALLEEVFSAADHPTTSGYQKVNQEILPILKQDSFHGVSRTVRAIQDSMLYFTEFLIEHNRLLDLRFVKEEALSQFERMYKYPTEQEARAIAKTPVFALTSHSQSQRRDLASSIEIPELIDILARVALAQRDFHPSWVWLQGSMAISNRFVASAGRLLSFFESTRLKHLN
jgi:FMN phosphatase YigB (HAD superfamily)